MCATSKAKIKGKNVDVNMGYNGGVIEIGNVYFSDESKAEERTTMKNCMLKFTKIELIDMVLDLIVNAEEG